MYAFQTGDLEKVMGIPIPFRKWLLVKWNKQKAIENKKGGDSDPNEPMTQAERIKFIKKAQEVSPSQSNQNFMQPMRNKK